MPEDPSSSGDVRMRGFRDRSAVEEVQAWVDGLPRRPAVEEVPLDEARGRVLGADLVAEVHVPAFPRAAMDGWAVRGADTFGAAETDPITLQVVGVSLPGRPLDVAVGPREAVRIMTGAPVPEGADAVLRAEDGRESHGRLEVRSAVTPARHVGQIGEDVRAGGRLLATGRRLRPQDLGLAASVGRDRLVVKARPRVNLLVTGDELLPPGRRPEGVRIVDANSPMLRALVERDGGSLEAVRYVPDEITAVEEALAGTGGDVLLVSGGSSVGEEDHAPRVLAALGSLVHHGVRLRPASPVGVGLLDGTPVFLLPGNPVSCLCGYDFFAGRFVRRAAGRAPGWPYAARTTALARKISSVLGRVDYVRVSIAEDGRADPRMSRGASILSSTTEADGFVVVPQDREGWSEGTDVEVWMYEGA